VAEAQTSSKKGLTRGKAILIGILSVVLVAVLYVQFGGKTEKPTSEATGYRPPRPALAVQPANSTAKPVTLASAKSPTNAQVSNAQMGKDKGAATALLIDETRWKSPKLDTIVAYDPFALPPSFPQPPKLAAGAKGNGAESLMAAAAADEAKKMADEIVKQRMELEELRQRGVHVILRKGDEYVAVIGDRMLHVGDKINEFTVTAIDPDDGVHIERKESP
jgi:hypothetical protein